MFMCQLPLSELRFGQTDEQTVENIIIKTETAKPVYQFCNAVNPPAQIVMCNNSVADFEVYENRLHIDPNQ